ncbi:MAG: transketolase C-terminal domain-containing protein [Candidatus Heimdallarchaeota archaeon]
MDDAEVVIVATGITARSALQAVMDGREQGIKVGLLRLITVWPFPREKILEIAQKAELVVAEMSMGQLIWPVERFAQKKCKLVSRIGGTPPSPHEILEGVKEVA